IAAAVIAYGERDGANEGAGRCYPDDTGYTAVNPPLVFKVAGAGDVRDPNRWQPLQFDNLVLQNGIPIGDTVQQFVGVGWNRVTPFAFDRSDVDSRTGLFVDPGPQPHLRALGDETVKAAMVDLIRLSGGLDPGDGVRIDISP